MRGAAHFVFCRGGRHMNLDLLKKEVRERAVTARDQIDTAMRNGAGEAVRRLFLDRVPLDAGMIVSGFWPSKGEIDVLPLLHDLHGAGFPCALPVVIGHGEPLEFRRWTPETTMEPGNFRIPVPPADAEVLSPRVLLVPLLAFDRRGHRLGWGAGFYDRTLAALRAAHEALAVGIAFSAQQVDRVPTGPFDQPLDWLVTEREAVHFSAAP